MKTYGKVLVGLGCGIAAGAILGILFAPDKGSVTRRKIVDATDEYTNKLKTMKASITGSSKVGHNGNEKRAKVGEPI